VAPVEPSADLRTFANFLHQAYVALVAEGFTEKQALAVLGTVISEGFSANRGDG